MSLAVSALEETTHRLEEVAREDPLRRAFLSRVLRVIARAVDEIPEAQLGEATSAGSDFAVLLAVLTQTDAVAALRSESSTLPACLRGLEMKDAIVNAEGGSWTVAEASKHLGLRGRQSVHKRIKKRALIALDVGRHGYLLPKWQFSKDVLGHLPEVLDALDADDPWTQATFFLTPDPRLKDQRPLDVLRAGNIAAVLGAARAHDQHGAA